MSIPAVGTKVKITTRHRKRSYWHPDRDYEDFEIVGEILPSFKWLSPQEFVVSNAKHPQGSSVVNLANVIDFKDLSGKTIKISLPKDDYKEWTFTGSKGNSYLVIRSQGRYNCTCAGFTFRKHCKHIQEASHGK